MVILLLWRCANITFVIVFISHSKEVKKQDVNAIEQDFRKAFAIEDDEVFEDFDSDEEDDEESEERDDSDSGASSAISRKQYLKEQ